MKIWMICLVACVVGSLSVADAQQTPDKTGVFSIDLLALDQSILDTFDITYQSNKEIIFSFWMPLSEKFPEGIYRVNLDLLDEDGQTRTRSLGIPGSSITLTVKCEKSEDNEEEYSCYRNQILTEAQHTELLKKL
ncbi:MAG: hypothetical protein R3A11_08580 [Bdellovibrionota bacterium]